MINAEVMTITPDMDPVDAYTRIESAVAGDIVEIAPGTYYFRLYLDNDGKADNPITIRAKDPYNRPVWDLSGKSCEQFPGSYNAGDAGRGAWQITGSNYNISGIIIRNSHILTSSSSSAGVRTVYDPENISFRNCLFEHNDNGVFGDGKNIVFEFCEFSGNGAIIKGKSPTHNLYVSADLKVRFSYIHDAYSGQNLHIRSKDALFEYNVIENSGSYMADLMTNTAREKGDPMNQTMSFLGNLFIEKTAPQNSGQIFVMYNDADYEKTRMRINLYYNTFTGFGQTAGLIHFTNNSGHELEYQEAYVYNNIIYNNKVPYNIDDDLDPGTIRFVFKNNWWSGSEDDYAGYDMDISFFGSDPGFIDYEKDDFRIRQDSLAVQKADPFLGIIPHYEIVFNNSASMLYKVREEAKDLGAFESTTSGEVYSWDGKYRQCTRIADVQEMVVRFMKSGIILSELLETLARWKQGCL